jgi:hypothetical protein
VHFTAAISVRAARPIFFAEFANPQRILYIFNGEKGKKQAFLKHREGKSTHF